VRSLVAEAEAELRRAGGKPPDGKNAMGVASERGMENPPANLPAAKVTDFRADVEARIPLRVAR
jgi:hypothetical protein